MTTEFPTKKSAQAASELLRNCPPSLEERLELANALERLESAAYAVTDAIPAWAYEVRSEVVPLSQACSFLASMIRELSSDDVNGAAIMAQIRQHIVVMASHIGTLTNDKYAALDALVEGYQPVHWDRWMTGSLSVRRAIDLRRLFDLTRQLEENELGAATDLLCERAGDQEVGA